MRDPFVTILVNNFNYGRFLRSAIDSALAQTYRHFEVVVVDDGSTDDSREVIASYGDRVRAVFKANGGQASAFNAGFAASKGDYICFLDADDYLKPEKVEHVVRQIANSPDCSVICHRVQPVNNNGEAAAPARPRNLYRGEISSRVRQAGGCWPHPPTSGMTFSRRFLEKVLPMPEAMYRTCADLYLAMLAPLFGTVERCDEILAMYRIHGGNAWATAGAESVAQSLTKDLQRLEGNLASVNSKLSDAGLARLDPEKNLPRQLLRYRLGQGVSGWRLVGNALNWPGESLAVRAKMLWANRHHVVCGVNSLPAKEVAS